MHSSDAPRPENRLLADFLRSITNGWVPHLELVKFQLGEIVYNPKERIKYYRGQE